MTGYWNARNAKTAEAKKAERERESSYRRGFDQAIAFMLYDAGATNSEVQAWTYKRKVAEWRSRANRFQVNREEAPRQDCHDVHNFRDIIAKLLLRPCNES